LAEIVPVVSEALEAKVRDLLPSQRGFGQDLQASNVIMPIIDLTAAAQGTTTPEYLQTAFAFGSQTSFYITTGSQVLVNTPGFWRVYAQLSFETGTSTGLGNLVLSDGLSTKSIWLVQGLGTTTADTEAIANVDIIVFLRAGDSLTGSVSATGTEVFHITLRQVADVNGNLVNPVGFTPQ